MNQKTFLTLYTQTQPITLYYKIRTLRSDNQTGPNQFLVGRWSWAGVPWCFDVCKQQVVVEKKRNGQLDHRRAPHQHVWTQVGPQPQPTQVEERGNPLYKNTHTVWTPQSSDTLRERSGAEERLWWGRLNTQGNQFELDKIAK
jgi:hypothetical protein